jgi:hypothetical protein
MFIYYGYSLNEAISKTKLTVDKAILQGAQSGNSFDSEVQELCQLKPATNQIIRLTKKIIVYEKNPLN